MKPMKKKIIIIIAHIISPKYSDLSKGEQKAVDNLQERDDIVFVNVN